MRRACIFIFTVLLSMSLSVNALADVSNKAYGWGFVKSKNGVPADAGPELHSIAEKHHAIYKHNTQDKVLYLTFDNGYENGYTARVLDILKAQKVPGIFFVTGHYLKTAPDLAKRMVKEGHLIGNHSWHHPDLTTLSSEKIIIELDTVRKETKKLTGQKTMQYLRPPRGIFSERTMDIANRAGYVHIFWSLAYKDWDINNQKGSAYAYNEIMKQIHPGAILLIHTISKDNADALEKVITDLKKQGYSFKSIDDLLMKQEIKGGVM